MKSWKEYISPIEAKLEDYPDKAVEVVSLILSTLFKDDETGELDPDKEWSSDTLEEIKGHLEYFGLLPKGD